MIALLDVLVFLMAPPPSPHLPPPCPPPCHRHPPPSLTLPSHASPPQFPPSRPCLVSIVARIAITTVTPATICEQKRTST
uniref:Secreted protein n=1 Tax=Angiostrongylus cantonensis TaxID=6313 RepID=A0A0K0DPX1_ANGCA